MNIVLSKSKLKFFKTYLRKEKDLIKKYINIDMTIGGNMLIAKIFSALIMVCIYGYGGYIVIKGNMTLGTLLAFQEYTTMFIGPCINIIRANNRIQQTKVSIDRVYFLLDEESDIKINDKGYKLLKGNINEIEFKDVYFKYLNKEKADSNYVLKDINLMFKKGATSAIVGESGCGKTTLVNLIYRFWDVNEGKILIDGINIKDINLLTLRKSISVVSQDILMLDDSIRNNIILSSTINDEEILRICEVVGLTDFVKGLKDGLDTVIGEKGVKISGGQRQRISIARALVNDNDILVFDEATSALDNISQAYILKNMKKYMQDKIVIIIAHRLSTIKDADNIYVLHNGKIVESGNKEELKLNDGIYNKLVKADA
jgi:ABC-type multidrug transport system fused ATPase/permease subunit